MNTALFILFWLGSGAIGYKLTQYWWTKDLDWTGSKMLLAVFLSIILGPINVIVGLILILTGVLFSLPFNSKVIKPRRNK